MIFIKFPFFISDVLIVVFHVYELLGRFFLLMYMFVIGRIICDISITHLIFFIFHINLRLANHTYFTFVQSIWKYSSCYSRRLVFLCDDICDIIHLVFFLPDHLMIFSSYQNIDLKTNLIV